MSSVDLYLPRGTNMVFTSAGLCNYMWNIFTENWIIEYNANWDSDKKIIPLSLQVLTAYM